MTSTQKIPQARFPDPHLLHAAKKARRWPKRTGKMLLAAAVAIGAAFSVAHFTDVNGYFVIPKPANIYLSQPAFAQLQRDTNAVRSASKDQQVSSYFKVAMIRKNVPLTRMDATATAVENLYSKEVSVYSSENSAGAVINKAAGINLPPSPTGLTMRDLYGGPLSLAYLNSNTATLQIETDKEIANRYYVTLVYYNVIDTANQIQYFEYALATDQGVAHPGISTKQEIRINTNIAEKTLQDIMLLRASGGTGVGQIAFSYNYSAEHMYKATQQSVDWIKKKNRIILPAVAAVSVLYLGISLARYRRNNLYRPPKPEWPS